MMGTSFEKECKVLLCLLLFNSQYEYNKCQVMHRVYWGIQSDV